MCPGHAANTRVRRSRSRRGSEAKYQAAHERDTTVLLDEPLQFGVGVEDDRFAARAREHGGDRLRRGLLAGGGQRQRVFGRPAACVRSARPVSRSTYSAGRGWKPSSNGR